MISIDNKYNFEIIYASEDCIILKSKYHYWRIIQNGEALFLHHKHHENDNFHVQIHKPFYSVASILKYIKSHDDYVESCN